MSSKYLRILLTLLVVVTGELKADECSDTTEVRVAIVVAGAVSLGAFEAGVLAEVVHQLKCRNNVVDGRKYVIDILAGASAGSINIALLAHELLSESGHRCSNDSINALAPNDKFARNGRFYDVWVDSLEILKFLPHETEWIKDNSFLLDTAFLDKLRDNIFSDQIGHQFPDYIDQELYIGMTLANMEGLNTALATHDTSRAVYTFHKDQIYFKIDKDGCQRVDDNLEALQDEAAAVRNWRDPVNAAIASGSFPFVFPPRTLTRYAQEYRRRSVITESLDSMSVKYVDGGFFNNQPLHIALQMANQIDKKAGADRPQRLFFLLAPNIKTEDLQAVRRDTSRVGEVTTSRVLKDKLNDYVGKIFDMGLKTAGSGDLANFLEENRRSSENFVNLYKSVYQIELDSQRIDSIQTMLKVLQAINEDKRAEPANTLEPVPLVSTNPSSLPLVQLTSLPRSDSTNIDAFLQPYIEGVLPKPAKGPGTWTGETAVDSIRRERGNSLQDRLVMELVLLNGLNPARRFVPVSKGEFNLAGSSLFGFGGFLNSDLRKHDFVVGQYTGQQLLRRLFNLQLPRSELIAEDEVKDMTESLLSALPFFRYGATSLYNHYERSFKGKKARRGLRNQLAKRLRFFARSQVNGNVFVRAGLSEFAKGYLDRNLFHLNQVFRYHLAFNFQSPKSLALGVRVNPFNSKDLWARHYEHFNDAGQVDFKKWMLRGLIHETYLVTDLLSPVSEFDLHGRLGLMTRLSYPHFTFVKLVPEAGYQFAKFGKFRWDQNGYAAVSLRILLLDFRFQWLQQYKYRLRDTQFHLGFSFATNHFIEALNL